jgi:Zn-dependent protease with chaperone function
MVMPARMMGKLSVEEWRPLIASSLVFEKKIKRTLRGRAFLLTGLPVMLALGGTIGAAIVLRISWVVFLYPVILLPLAILGGRSYNSDLKKARLEADKQAAALIGKNSLQDVLKKIDLMGLSDVDKLKSGRGGRRLASLPSITERIENLQGVSSLAGYSTT